MSARHLAMFKAQAAAEMRTLTDFIRTATMIYCLKKAGKYRTWIDPHGNTWFMEEKVNTDI